MSHTAVSATQALKHKTAVKITVRNVCNLSLQYFSALGSLGRIKILIL